MLYNIIKILLLSFIQNISFTLVSRSRNRDNKQFFIVSSLFSNSIWFFTFRELILADMGLELLIPYMVGSLLGSIFGMNVSMRIEKMLNASADSHISQKIPTPGDKKS